MATLRGHIGGVRGVALSADARLLASSSFDGSIRRWRVDDRRELVALEEHASPVWAWH